MEEDNNYHENSNNNHHLSIIDEKPELTTLLEDSNMQNDDESLLSKKIISKLSKGYTFYTVIKVLSYSINETSLILPYCLRRLGIIPFFLFLIIFSLSSLYIFYLLIDIIVKKNLFSDYHKKIQEKTNKIFNILYYIVNIIYNILILIFENYLYLSLCQKILSFFGIDISYKFYIKIIILSISFLIIEFPFSFIKFFQKPDLLYFLITFLIIVLNIIALFIMIFDKSDDDITLIKFKAFEGISKDYFTCFSIIMTIIGWQNKISNQLESFKIKTTKRFYKVIYLFFIYQSILIIFICFVSAPLISDKGDAIIFLLDYKNLNLAHLLIIQIMAIIFCFVIHIIIAHHINLIQENFCLIVSLILCQNQENDFKLNKILYICFNFFILFVSNVLSLIINDISIIIILYGGIFSTLINYLFPTIMYFMMVSKNSLAIWFGWLITFIIISFGIMALAFKILL